MPISGTEITKDELQAEFMLLKMQAEMYSLTLIIIFNIMKVYVLVLVTYDHYRFQYNVAVYDDKKKCEERAKKEDEDKPVYYYNDNYDENLDSREESHFCVQEYAVVAANN